jgi:regulator of replication initiation timing
LERARAREEVSRLSGQLKEVRASNAQLEKDLKESVEERRRLTQEVLELRAAEERLMPMERIEKELEESCTEQLTPQLAGAAMKDGAKPGRMLGGASRRRGPLDSSFGPDRGMPQCYKGNVVLLLALLVYEPLQLLQ